MFMRGALRIEKPPKGIFLSLCDGHGSEMTLKEFFGVLHVLYGVFLRAAKRRFVRFFLDPLLSSIFSVLRHCSMSLRPPQHSRALPPPHSVGWACARRLIQECTPTHPIPLALHARDTHNVHQTHHNEPTQSVHTTIHNTNQAFHTCQAHHTNQAHYPQQVHHHTDHAHQTSQALQTKLIAHATLTSHMRAP